MPYDPTFPATDVLLVSAEFRSQFTGLKALIDAVPTITSAEVDAVDTLAPGEPASVSVSIVAGVLHVSFGIPQGDAGDPGPPFANAVVDGVSTLDPGDAATVDVVFDGTDVHFAFGIPRGATGEVSDATLDAAIAGTSNSSNAVDTLGLAVSDPPTQAEMQTLASKVDELITAMRR